MQYTYRDIFSTAQSSFWTCRFWCFLVLLPFFCFTSTSTKHFPLRTFFVKGNKKNLLRVRLGKWGGWSTRVMRFFDQKLLKTQHSMGRCAPKSPMMKWANALSRQKKFTEAEHSLSQQRQLVYWYRWVPRTLISLGKPELQEVCPPENNSRVFWVPHHNVLPRTTATKAIQRHTWKKTYINQNEILKKYRKKKWEMWNWENKRKTKNKMADLSPKINDYTKCKWYKDTNGQKVGKVYWKHDPTIYCL